MYDGKIDGILLGKDEENHLEDEIGNGKCVSIYSWLNWIVL